MNCLWAGVGGAIGSILRFYLQSAVQTGAGTAFPVGTLTVNLIGSAVIGVLAGLFESLAAPSPLRVFLFVGVLGGFTTFSSFSLENLNLLRAGQIRSAFTYIVLSNALGIGLAAAGYLAAKSMFRTAG